MSKIMKFREPDNIFPSSLSNSSQNLFALVLCEISRIKGSNVAISKREGEHQKLEIPNKYRFSEETLIERFNCSKDNIRMVLEPAARSLISKLIGISEEGKFRYFSLASEVYYESGGFLEITLNPSSLAKISEYKGYSEMELLTFISLNKISKRLFRYISRFKSLDYEYPLIPVDDFKELIGVKGKYPQYTNFRKVLIKAFKDIITATNSNWKAIDEKGIGFETKRTGRSVTHIKVCLEFVGSGVNSASLTKLDAIEAFEALENNLPITERDLLNLEKHFSDLIYEYAVVISPEIVKKMRELKESFKKEND